MKAFSAGLLCLVSLCSAVSGERYKGEGDVGWFQSRVWGTNGVGDFILRGTPHLSVDLSVDRSQNVTFHDFTVTFAGRLDFAGHGGEVYSDLTFTTTTSQALDLNPFANGEHMFGIAPFYFGPIAVAGTYVNRGFENTFAHTFTKRNGFPQQFVLSFADFPDRLAITGTSSYGYYEADINEGPLLLEPLLQMKSIELSIAGDAFPLVPVPPMEFADVLGDSNFDGRFDSSDLVAVFQAGEYEDAIVGNSTWETGDWNADLDFDSGDLVAAFTAGTYQSTAVAVPEPSSVVILLSGLLSLAGLRR